jgi:hypothetical protein
MTVTKKRTGEQYSVRGMCTDKLNASKGICAGIIGLSWFCLRQAMRFTLTVQ